MGLGSRHPIMILETFEYLQNFFLKNGVARKSLTRNFLSLQRAIIQIVKIFKSMSDLWVLESDLQL